MKKLYISFLWHMHQPYYKDDLSGLIKMPWVFLHAIKDYYDMVWYVERFSKIKGTFNLVPSLLVQLKEYEDFHVNDELLNAIRKDVDFLSDEEREYLIEYLFFSNEENCIKPLKRYGELLEKKRRFSSNKEASKAFLNREFQDLEVLFLLSWCGEYLKQNDKVVKDLIKKGRDFTHEDKIELLKTLSSFISKIIPYYKRVQEEGKIEISTTPFYHPIEPLLFDIKNASLSNPSTPLPKDPISLKDDGIKHIDYAISYYESSFGRKPIGFWPAEGSVSYEFLEELSKREILWACSDEEILYKTVKAFRKEDIYKRNRLHFKEGGIYLFFRDRELSDLIGFSYSGWDEDRAVNDFISRLEAIYNLSNEDQNVNVILDGENAWEHYRDNAFYFFDKLYRKIEEISWLECSFFTDITKKETIEERELYNLTPGSWINGDFRIWIGHEEKNRAWELIFKTKRDFLEKKEEFEESLLKKIEKEFMIAEGSDWFWWYGDDHFTVQKEEFDSLFRKHLINIYTLMQKIPPKELLKPIVHTDKDEIFFIKEPQNMITPIIDGKNSNFFEWLEAGEADLEHELSSMSLKNFVIEKIKFGHDRDFFYVSLIGDIKSLLDRSYLEIEIDKDLESIEIKRGVYKKDFIEFGVDDIVEMKFLREFIEGKKIGFKLFIDGKLVQVMPLYTKIEAKFGNESLKNWYV
ncbi:MAG: glycoside hydrolase [Epsilonproteobacteria bacterium]|nr:glycoside hydrolase [Campylobacterota bacterium]